MFHWRRKRKRPFSRYPWIVIIDHCIINKHVVCGKPIPLTNNLIRRGGRGYINFYRQFPVNVG